MGTAELQKEHSIAIVGGGIAGLTLAVGMHRRDVPFTLYEAAPTFAEMGAGVSIGANAARAMELIDPEILQAYECRRTENGWESKKKLWFDFRYGMGRRAADGSICEERVGQHIVGLESPPGLGGVHRADFLDELVKLLPKGMTRLGLRLVNFSDEGPEKGVVLHFADGSSARHLAMVATDGIKSRTRELLLGEDHPAAKAVFSGKYAYRGLVPMDQAVKVLGEELARNAQMHLGLHGHVLTFPIQDGKTMNVVAFHSKDEWEGEWVQTADNKQLCSDFASFGKHVTELVSLMKASDVWAMFNHPNAPSYFKGRVCLIGDAAHASTPHCGAGAGMAIEDAYVMSALLGHETVDGSIEGSFKAFDTVRRERTQRLVEQSRRHGQIYDLEDRKCGDQRETLAEVLIHNMKWIWEEDLEAELRRALEFLDQDRSNNT